MIIDLKETVQAGEDEVVHNSHHDIINKYAKKGRSVIGIVEQVITKEDGSEMYKLVGTNCTTMEGTTNLVENLYGDLFNKDGSIYDFESYYSNVRLDTLSWLGGDANILTDGADPNGRDGENNKKTARKIIGIMLADDGAENMSLNVINRASHNLDFNRVLPFKRGAIGVVNDVDEDMDYNTSGNVSGNDKYRQLVEGKYAFKVQYNNNGQIGYLVKLQPFTVDNIQINGTTIDTTDRDKIGAVRQDVRTRITTLIKITDNMIGYDNHSLTRHDGRTVAGESLQPNKFISSLMLVAARKTAPVADRYSDGIFTDFIITNKINFLPVPINKGETIFRYTLYYV